MTRYDLLESADSQELTEWGLLFGIHAEEAELRDEGLTSEQVADVMAGELKRDEVEGEGQQAVDAFLGPEAAAARRAEIQARLMAEEDEDNDED